LKNSVRPRQGGWTVRGSYGDYEIDNTSPLRCQCAWEREHSGTRGPCKHILAVLLSSTA